MILLLGATSYIGQAFARALRRRNDAFVPLTRSAFDYACFEFLFDYVRKMKPEFVINAAEYTNRPNSEDGEVDRMEMLQTNALLPQTVARVCGLTKTPWGHVSSGSIYSGGKILNNGKMRVERDLTQPQVRGLFASHPEVFFGFTEQDEPNYSFKHGGCTFYSGTKALAEEALQSQNQTYIWRFRLPFSEHDEPENFLTQVRGGQKLYDAVNSLSHLDDCVGACLDLWGRGAPFGIYNVVNPGAIGIHEVAQMIQRILEPPRQFQLLTYDGHPDAIDGGLPRPVCLLDDSKLFKTGIRLRGVKEAVEKSLKKWESRNPGLWKTIAG